MAKSVKYDLAQVGLNIVGIPGVNRICIGTITLTQVSGNDRVTIVPTETGNDVLQFHNQSKSYEVALEVPRGHAQMLQLHSVFQEWNKDGNWMTPFSASVKVDANYTISSDECVMDNYDWGSAGLSTPGSTFNVRFKMANGREIIQDVRG